MGENVNNRFVDPISETSVKIGESLVGLFLFGVIAVAIVYLLFIFAIIGIAYWLFGWVGGVVILVGFVVLGAVHAFFE